MRIGLIVAAICLSVVGLAAAEGAKAAMRKDTSIPPGGLGPALQTLAKEYDFQVLYRTEVVGSLRTEGAVGQFTSEEALKQVLKGTGLTYRYLDEKTITIMPASAGSIGAGSGSPASPTTSPPTSSGDSQEAKTGSSEAFLLAQATVGQAPGNTSVESQQKRAATTGSEIPLQEVIVTAQKRQERLQDVPISIVALAGDDLRKLNVVSIDDLATVVPGLSVQDDGDVRRIALRGAANVFGNASLIGIYLDEADVTSTGSTQLPLDTYDLQRVEALRGPQGTLYGEGSVGGTIRFITNNPDPSRFSFNADVAALFTQDGAPSQRVQEVLNVPLLENTLAIRVAGQFDHEGGWIDQPAANQTNINGQNIADVRTKVLWQPVTALTVTAMAEIHRNQEGPSSGEDANGNYVQVFDLTTTPRITENYDLYNLTITYDTAWARLLNSASYFNQYNDAYNREHYFQLTAPPSTPFEEYLPLSTQNESSFNDELRLTSVGSGPWQWTAGAFYRNFKNDASIPGYYFGLPGPPGAPLPGPYPYSTAYQSKAWSIFADTSLRLLDHLTLGVGVRRYSDDEYAYDPLQSASFHSLDPRFYATLKLTDDANIYASAAKGFRSGGFNSSGQPTFGPESVWTYELGGKAVFPGPRLSIDADIFYTDYSGYVVYGVAPGTVFGISQNAGDAVLKGIEWDVVWHAADQWTMSVSGDYLDTYFTSIRLVPSSAPVQVGDNIDFTPKYQGNASVQRDFTWNNKSAYARLDYRLQGRDTYRNRSIGPWYFSESDVIHMLNFSTGIQCNESLSLQIFAQNLLNDRGYTSPIVIETDAARNRPRTYGVDFAVKF